MLFGAVLTASFETRAPDSARALPGERAPQMTSESFAAYEATSYLRLVSLFRLFLGNQFGFLA